MTIVIIAVLFDLYTEYQSSKYRPVSVSSDHPSFQKLSQGKQLVSFQKPFLNISSCGPANSYASSKSVYSSHEDDYC